MLKRIIEWSVNNKLLVLVFTALAVAAGVIAVRRTPLEALPDLSDVQVIVQTDYEGQAPQIVEMMLRLLPALLDVLLSHDVFADHPPCLGHA